MPIFRMTVRDGDPECDLWGQVDIEADSPELADEKLRGYLKEMVDEGSTDIDLSSLQLESSCIEP